MQTGSSEAGCWVTSGADGFITDLWLEESLRGSGLGRRLMEIAEAEARQDGCRYVHLDSHSFQAPEFYKKLGYEEFGRLKDSPLGYDQVFLWKRL